MALRAHSCAADTWAVILVLLCGSKALGATVNCNCTTEYSPVCGIDGNTYSNKCFAECQLGKGKWVAGRCPTELNPVAGCIGTAKCARNPCDDPWSANCTNKLPANAVCFINSCTDIQYQNQTLPTCGALWVDPATKNLITCQAPAVCACTKIYLPVCGSDGKTYANKCLAQCALGASGKWVKGACEDFSPFAGCTRPSGILCRADVCDNRCSGVSNTSTCFFSNCMQQIVGNASVSACSAVWVDPFNKNKTVVCKAPVALDPFAGCAGNVRCLRNTCATKCSAASAASVCFQNTCSGQSLNGVPVDPCAAVWVDPFTKKAVVCDGETPAVRCPPGGPMAMCKADPCAVLPPKCAAAADAADAVCMPVYCERGELPDGTTVHACSAVFQMPDGTVTTCDTLPPVDKVCICTMIWAPVCSTDNVTYSNACAAECADATVARNGACEDVDAGCICTQQYDPVCGTDGKTYGNACDAQCAHTTVASNGTCEDAGCFCTEQYDPVCGTDGKTYGNACEAGCAHVAVEYSGRCTPQLPKCPAKDTVVCFANPCSVTSCPANPSATCLASYCKNSTYDGQPVGPCEAVYVDENGSRVDCTASSSDIKCTSSQVVNCFVDPCAVASCPANPSATCKASYCEEGTIQGRTVGPCEAVFVDSAGELVDCTPSCSSCSLDYTPVCGTDNKTYPNSCAAACLGKTVAFDGKCSSCTGKNCLVALPNNLCILGSGQCQSKYECTVTTSTKKTNFLGQCVLKTGGRRHAAHHRHLLA